MHAPRPTRVIALLVALGATAAAAQGRPPKADLKRPLVVASQEPAGGWTILPATGAGLPEPAIGCFDYRLHAVKAGSTAQLPIIYASPVDHARCSCQFPLKPRSCTSSQRALAQPDTMAGGEVQVSPACRDRPRHPDDLIEQPCPPTSGKIPP